MEDPLRRLAVPYHGVASHGDAVFLCPSHHFLSIAVKECGEISGFLALLLA